MGKGTLIIVAAAVLSGGMLLHQATKISASADAKQSEYEVELIARDIARSGMSFVANEALTAFEEGGLDDAVLTVDNESVSYQKGSYTASARADGNTLVLEVTGEREWNSTPVTHTVRRYYAVDSKYKYDPPSESVGDEDGLEGPDGLDDIEWGNEFVLTVLGNMRSMHAPSGSYGVHGEDRLPDSDAHIKGMGLLPTSFDRMEGFKVNEDRITGVLDGGEVGGGSIYSFDPENHLLRAEALYQLAVAKAKDGTQLSGSSEDGGKGKGKGKGGGDSADEGYVYQLTSQPPAGCTSSEVRYLSRTSGRMSFSGCGVLVVDGSLEFAAGSNSMHWKGLVIAKNDRHLDVDLRGQGGVPRVEGAVILLAGEGALDSREWGSVDITFRGNNTIQHHSAALDHALRALGITKTDSELVLVGSSEGYEAVDAE